jgi:hypothetical protein
MVDLHDYIYFTYSEHIRDRQLLENGAGNENAPAYKRAAGNKMAIWERLRNSRSYELVKVIVVLQTPAQSIRPLEFLPVISESMSETAHDDFGPKIPV